jgi:Ca2+-dependent lipid-binding protein
MATMKIEIFLSCRKLRNLDRNLGNKSDPFVQLFTQSNNQWAPFDQTEVVKEDLNPDFHKTFQVDFMFEVS